jgi:amidase
MTSVSRLRRPSPVSVSSCSGLAVLVRRRETGCTLGAMHIRSYVCGAAMIFGVACGTEQRDSPGSPSEFELNELSVWQLQDGMQSGRYTSRKLVELYLERISQIDAAGPRLRSVIEINPDALALADALDAERKAKGARGPLHGIPVLIKDNIDTGDKMLTTAGSLALTGAPAPHDAFVVERLRAAGVVLLGKTNLSEWANIRSTKSTSGWSARGGLVKNPYVLDRNPCGSSSGTGAAIAANLAAVGVGTETDGSVVCPSSVAALVGIKPTIGLVSRSGIIPIAHSQDTAGPMTRTVTDAAVLLNAMVGVDPRDPATASTSSAREDYTAALKASALQGARIGVAREPYFGYSAPADSLIEAAIVGMKAQGATIVDPADIPTAARLDECEIEVLLYELKADLNAYLATRGTAAAASTLKELIAFNERERAREMPYFGQELFIRAEAKGPLTTPDYVAAATLCRRLAREQGIDAVMTTHRLDALVAPTLGPAWPTDLLNGDHITGSSSTPAAVAGYPSITVPAGWVGSLPVGILFMGRAWSESRLIGLAFAYEQATKHRRPPRFLPTIPLE